MHAIRQAQVSIQLRAAKPNASNHCHRDGRTVLARSHRPSIERSTPKRRSLRPSQPHVALIPERTREDRWAATTIPAANAGIEARPTRAQRAVATGPWELATSEPAT